MDSLFEPMKYWPLYLLLGSILLYAFRRGIIDRVKKDIDLDQYVLEKACGERHVSLEVLSVEIKTMVNDSLKTGERRMDKMEASSNGLTLAVSERIDRHGETMSLRFDTYEAVINSRYKSLEKHVDKSMIKFERKLEKHLEENGQ